MTSSKFVLLESIVLDPLKLIFATSSVNFSTYPEGSFCAWPSHRNSAKYLDTKCVRFRKLSAHFSRKPSLIVR